MTEAEILEGVRLLSTGDVRLLRTQSGAFQDVRGNYVHVGFKGLSDLNGWRSVTITADMVGKRFAQFVAIEVKAPRRHPTGEQWRYLCAVQDAGGLAGVAKSVDDARVILQLPRV